MDVTKNLFQETKCVELTLLKTTTQKRKSRHRFDVLFVQMLPYCTLKPYQLSKRARRYEEAEKKKV